jgi:hypothetical protein
MITPLIITPLIITPLIITPIVKFSFPAGNFRLYRCVVVALSVCLFVCLSSARLIFIVSVVGYVRVVRVAL